MAVQLQEFGQQPARNLLGAVTVTVSGLTRAARRDVVALLPYLALLSTSGISAFLITMPL